MIKEQSRFSDQIVLDFPLNGVWTAINTPAHQVPSHGTNYLAQRYAIDLAMMDEELRSIPPALIPRYVFKWVSISNFFGWASTILCPSEGIVVDLYDDQPDREALGYLGTKFRRLWPSKVDTRSDFKDLTGNYVIIKIESAYVLLAHLRHRSLLVNRGQKLQPFDPVAEVGNSGNSTGPHLHIQVMDGPDPRNAKGLRFCFRKLEYFEDTRWHPLSSGVPNRFQRIRRMIHGGE